MELFGFNKWTLINESFDSSYYQFDFKDPIDSLEERKTLAVNVIQAECQKLFPSYTTLVEVKDDIMITFTLKEDDFSLFSDTGSTQPFTANAPSFLRDSRIRQDAIRALDGNTKIFKQPRVSKKITILVIPGNKEIDAIIDRASNGMATQSYYRHQEIETPLESNLDEITFGKGDVYAFSRTLNTYLKYTYFIEYFKSSLVGKVKPSDNSTVNINSILAIRAEGKSATQLSEEINDILPVLRKLYYESEVNRYESKVSSDLFAKAITHLISQFGGTVELFKVLNKLSKSSKNTYNLF
jgi:hypothetical protein